MHHERVKALLRQERELGKRGSREILENVLKIEPKEEEEESVSEEDDSRSSVKAAGLFALDPLDDSPGEALDPLDEVKVEESEEDSVVDVSDDSDDDDSIVEVEMEKCELCSESFGAQYQVNVHIALAHFREGSWSGGGGPRATRGVQSAGGSRR